MTTPDGSPATMTVSKWRGRRAMLAQFIEKPTVIGAVTPSSVELATLMVNQVDLGIARAVVEYGPGTGVVTDVLLPRLAPGAKFMAIELNPTMAAAFRSRHPGVNLRHDSVEHIRRLCDEEGIEQLDCIISGLPWASFSSDLQDRLLEATLTVLKPGGHLVTFAYHVGTWLPAGRRFARKLPRFFSKVEKSRSVWRNLPPAFVVRCTK